MNAVPPGVESAALGIAADHPAYRGHFRGMPVLPGAVLLDAALDAISRSRGLDLTHWRVGNAKFLEPVGPGDALVLEHWPATATTLRFVIRTARHVVASGMLSHGA